MKQYICVTGITEGEKRDKGAAEKFEEIMAKNYPKLVTDTKSQSHKVQSDTVPPASQELCIQGKYQKYQIQAYHIQTTVFP